MVLLSEASFVLLWQISRLIEMKHDNRTALANAACRVHIITVARNKARRTEAMAVLLDCSRFSNCFRHESNQNLSGNAVGWYRQDIRGTLQKSTSNRFVVLNLPKNRKAKHSYWSQKREQRRNCANYFSLIHRIFTSQRRCPVWKKVTTNKERKHIIMWLFSLTHSYTLPHYCTYQLSSEDSVSCNGA